MSLSGPRKPLTAAGRLQVTVVDDDPSLVAVVRQLLEHRGHSVTPFASGLLALDAIPLAIPDVLLLDLHMPGVDGNDLCRRLAEQLGDRMPPVVFLSASHDEDVLSRGLASPHARHLLRKPFRMGDLVSLVESSAKADAATANNVAGWVLNAELGRGGTGVVYRAMPHGGGMQVAIKVLQTTVADPQDELDLRRELVTLCRLKHPGIVRVHAAGLEGARPYFVMDLLSGANLRDAVGDGAWPVPRALHVLSQVATALAYLHGEGVVHRDLKPGNVMLEGSRALLVDFGTARHVHEYASLDQAQMITPLFTAPEMARGLFNTTEADVFALGVMLYRTLSGRFPVVPEGNGSFAFARAYAKQAIRLPDAAPPGTPLGDLLLQMLQVEPAARPTAKDVASRLSALLRAAQ